MSVPKDLELYTSAKELITQSPKLHYAYFPNYIDKTYKRLFLDKYGDQNAYWEMSYHKKKYTKPPTNKNNQSYDQMTSKLQDIHNMSSTKKALVWSDTLLNTEECTKKIKTRDLYIAGHPIHYPKHIQPKARLMRKI